jgi:hypothetical protein
MNNFLDLLDTDPYIEIDICVSPCCDNGAPICQIQVNQTMLFDAHLTDIQQLTYRSNLLDPIKIQISMQGKIYSADRETGITLDQVSIDGFDIVPKWTHLAEYQNDHLVTDPVGYLGYNGTWTLDITEPFYRWRHRVTGQGWLLEPTTRFLD